MLQKFPAFAGVKGPVVVIVMDGYGIPKHEVGSAIDAARKPTLDRLFAECPNIRLRAHGTAVGMPSDDDMGNSEVGHNAIGAGRVFDQGAKLCGRAIASGKLFEGKVWRAMIDRVGAPRPANDGQRTMHFIGLLSDGNVHSHIDQLVALVRRCDSDGVRRVRLHVLLDGRDVPATSALTYVDQIEAVLGEISGKADRDYRIASGGGRMLVTMDRYEADWGMVELGWKTHVRGEGRTFASARAAIETARAEDPSKNDQYLPAFVIAGDDGKPVGPIRDGDGVVFFNFRGDRAIEISRAFEDESFAYFDRGARPDVLYAGMMQYDGDLALP